MKRDLTFSVIVLFFIVSLTASCSYFVFDCAPKQNNEAVKKILEKTPKIGGVYVFKEMVVGTEKNADRFPNKIFDKYQAPELGTTKADTIIYLLFSNEIQKVFEIQQSKDSISIGSFTCCNKKIFDQLFSEGKRKVQFKASEEDSMEISITYKDDSLSINSTNTNLKTGEVKKEAATSKYYIVGELLCLESSESLLKSMPLISKDDSKNYLTVVDNQLYYVKKQDTGKNYEISKITLTDGNIEVSQLSSNNQENIDSLFNSLGVTRNGDIIKYNASKLTALYASSLENSQELIRIEGFPSILQNGEKSTFWYYVIGAILLIIIIGISISKKEKVDF